MEKIVLLILVFLLSLSIVYAADLSDYPNFFLDDEPNVIIVVGDKAPATHVIAQSSIALSLSAEFNKPLSSSNKLASEVEDIDDYNIISIGTACDNKITSLILDGPEPCNKDVAQNKASIQLFESDNDKIQIIISSDSEEGIKEAAEVLAKFEDLSGNLIELDVVNEDAPVPVLIKEETEEEKEQEIKAEVKKESEELSEEESKKAEITSEPEEAEPILKEEDDIVKIIVNWFKSIFNFFKR